MDSQLVQSTNGRSELPGDAPHDLGSLLIRPIRDSDSEALQSAFESLSPDTRYFRFHSPLRRLPNGLAHYLTHVDGVDHVALVAIDRSQRPAVGVGEARFIRDPGAPETAELAITVTDEAQGHGVARRLLETLGGEAQRRGIRSFTMLVLAGNHRVRRMLIQLGAVASGSPSEVIHFEIPVSALVAVVPAA